MKPWIRTFAFALLAAAAPVAAVVMPMRIPFQGKLIDPATNNPKNGAFSMQFKLYNAPTGGAALFTETQTVTVVNGQFTVQIGTVTYLSADLLSGASAYLGVTVGADAEMSPRQPLSMSPYAYTAVQLASDQNIRINSGITYSTFTTAGNLTLQYGVVGATATFMTVTSTNVGTYGVITSSGIDMNGGTLTLDPSSRGIDAQGTGIVATTATFMTVVSTNVGTFSVTTSSGINMGAGSLFLDADSRGISAIGTGIVASTANFVTVSTWAVQSSSGILISQGPLTLAAASNGLDARSSSVTARQFFGIGATTTSIKPADTNRASTVTLADDPHLAIPIGANEAYTVYSFFKSSSTSATPDFKMAFTVPSGCVMDFGCYSNGGTLATVGTFALRDSGGSSPLIALGASIINPVICVGSVVNGGTAGFLKMQWAQNTSNGTNTTLTAGSFISATRIK